MDGIAQQFADFAAGLTDVTDFIDTADHLVQYAVKATGATSGGITLILPKSRHESIAVTDDKVVEADHAQYSLGEGPCLDASSDLRSLASGSLSLDPRWPRWGPLAARLGFSSVLSAEIHSRGTRVGALNLYSAAPDGFSAEDVELARVLAAQSAVVLVTLSNEEKLHVALETRTLIGQAQGMLMERYGIDAPQAFSVLRRFSQDSNVKLRDVAAGLVESRKVPESTSALHE